MPVHASSLIDPIAALILLSMRTVIDPSAPASRAALAADAEQYPDSARTSTGAPEPIRAEVARALTPNGGRATGGRGWRQQCGESAASFEAVRSALQSSGGNREGVVVNIDEHHRLSGARAGWQQWCLFVEVGQEKGGDRVELS